MLGAIAGDIIGSVHEFIGTKTMDFPLFVENSDFTDDSVLSVAVAQVLLDGQPYAQTIQRYAQEYPGRGYGGRFTQWIQQDPPLPYDSWGNGSAMRVSPVGFAADSMEAVLEQAKRSAEVSHDHAEGIRGARGAAMAVFMACAGSTKEQIRIEIVDQLGYDLDFTIDGIRERYQYTESCAGTVPPAIVAFLDSEDYEHAIRLAISIGGDADTLACITGGIAEAFYGGVPAEIEERCRDILDSKLLTTVDRFRERFMT